MKRYPTGGKSTWKYCTNEKNYKMYWTDKITLEEIWRRGGDEKLL